MITVLLQAILLLLWTAVSSTQWYRIMQHDALGHYSLGRAVTCNSVPRYCRQVGQHNNIPQHGVYLPVLFSSYTIPRVSVNSKTWDQWEASVLNGTVYFLPNKRQLTAKIKAQTLSIQLQWWLTSFPASVTVVLSETHMKRERWWGLLCQKEHDWIPIRFLRQQYVRMVFTRSNCMCQSATNCKLSARKTHFNARYKGLTQTLYQPSMLKGVSVHNGLDSSF